MLIRQILQGEIPATDRISYFPKFIRRIQPTGTPWILCNVPTATVAQLNQQSRSHAPKLHGGGHYLRCFNNEHFKRLISELALRATTQFLQMFTEQRRRITPLVGEDVRARSYKGEAFAKELTKAEQLRFLVHGPVKSLAQAAIAFCIAHPAVSVTIAGVRNEAQMRENASGADVTVPAEDLAKIADLWRRGFAL